MSIFEKLSKIQQELKAPKNLYNSFGKYSYRNAEGILEAVKPLLGGLALIINDEPVMVGERYYIKATATLTDGKESVSATAYAREDETKKGMDGCQITGACSSYARKYALNALLMIDDAKDSDDDSLSPKNPKNEPEAPKKVAPKVRTDIPADVTTAAKIPEENPVKAYIANELGFMSQMFEITDKKELMDKFRAMRLALIDSGTIEDVDADHQTMEQAKAMFEAIYATFKPNGERK